MTQPPVNEQTNGQAGSSRLMPMVIYLCHLAFFVAGLGPVIGVFLAYLNRGAGPEWIESHYRYQIRTFWIGLLYALVSLVTAFVIIGIFFGIFTFIWWIVRCAKGLKSLSEGVPYEKPATWLW